MATIVSFSPNRALDLNGFSVPGARARFYDSGTSRLRTVYADAACETPHPSPLVADGAGVFPPVYDTGDGDVKVSVTTGDGVMLAGYPMDPARVISTDSAGASGIQFNPTEDIPETNVQDAIERVQANLIDPLLDYGLGVTGFAPLLTNIDAVNTPSGVYRFGADTVGTFPSGIAADNTGLVRLWRIAPFAALMILSTAGTRRQHSRVMAGSVWGGWSYVMQSTDTVSDAIWSAGDSSAPAVPSPAAIRAAIRADDRAWQNVTGSRTAGTVYQNTTGRTIEVMVHATAEPNQPIEVSANGTTEWVRIGYFVGNSSQGQGGAVPPGWRYRVGAGTSIAYWSELR
ncbi:hypothetical protein [Paracoccus sp. DMF]|uniref:hypothetical protein n=1 Tax=Paracoccus sp. DMF TaxID=400837 RepID=UPI001103D6FE|nr:hypothetical protein [Paracoccus sp. DMF]MCV2448894.1 hypothetical protein [Paracoccus sp. DMF]